MAEIEDDLSQPCPNCGNKVDRIVFFDGNVRVVLGECKFESGERPDVDAWLGSSSLYVDCGECSEELAELGATYDEVVKRAAFKAIAFPVKIRDETGATRE